MNQTQPIRCFDESYRLVGRYIQGKDLSQIEIERMGPEIKRPL